SYTFAVRARDAAGNTSAASAPVKATTSSGGSTPPPVSGGSAKVAPYVDMGSWPTPVLGDVTSASGLKSVTAAFITGSGCKATWFNSYDPRTGWQKDAFDKIKAAGGTVKLSFGGATGSELAQVCTTVPALTAEYNAVVDAYGATYLDFDV